MYESWSDLSCRGVSGGGAGVRRRTERASRAKAGDLRGAIADYGALIELDSEFVDAWRLRGELSAKDGDVTSAIKDLQRFLELAPRHQGAPAVRKLLGTLQKKK